jgi:hypothetical protein
MVNQESRFATDAFGDTIVQCLGCNGWTSDLEGEDFRVNSSICMMRWITMMMRTSGTGIATQATCMPLPLAGIVPKNNSQKVKINVAIKGFRAILSVW